MYGIFTKFFLGSHQEKIKKKRQRNFIQIGFMLIIYSTSLSLRLREIMKNIQNFAYDAIFHF